MAAENARRRSSGLIIVAVLSVTFLVVSFARIAGDALSPSFGRGVLDVVRLQPIFGTQMGVELALFVLALLFLHLLLAVVCWALARLSAIAWPDSGNTERALSLFWFVLLVLWILTANSYYYPRSSLGAPYAELVRQQFAGFTLYEIVSGGLALAIASVLIAAGLRRRSAIPPSRLAWSGGAALLVAGVALPAMDVLSRGPVSGTHFDQPNVIIIGIDSLRTDIVQNSELQFTPAVDAFLADAVQFSNAYTPLARTFPAWVSIVSGKHPHTTGAYVNLLPRSLIETGATLPSLLGESGYQTVYAIDEVRFSNLDLSYGFDAMLAPPMGAADFLLGFFADTPLANLAVNTAVGEWLFPYAYANRAATKTYDPDTFIDRLDGGVNFNRPTLLAAHFTLAHWPYTWASVATADRSRQVEDKESDPKRVNYDLAVQRVDQQFGELMQLLERKGALENAIVVVLSDHGESLGDALDIDEESRSRSLPVRTEGLSGHGTHVFSRDQYNVVLAMRSFGNDIVESGAGRVVDAPVTLEDLTPTLLDLLGIETTEDFDGESLLPVMAGNAFADKSRVRFLETEFNPPGISAAGMPSFSAILDTVDVYSIDVDTDRVSIRPEFTDDLLAKRQYAAERDGRILAAVPGQDETEQALLFFDSGSREIEWLDAPPTAADDELFSLWTALEHRFPPVRSRRIVPRPPEIDESEGQI